MQESTSQSETHGLGKSYVFPNQPKEEIAMKTKKLTPANATPLKRKTTAIASRDSTAIAPSHLPCLVGRCPLPFAGNDAE
ncbi:anacyclamide/piricyclamide family prenylated cyclic peptide [Oxynema aestuarii]|jgi:prenylated cyclic peptide (anacyclamide/piricyclamide family)